MLLIKYATLTISFLIFDNVIIANVIIDLCHDDQGRKSMFKHGG